MRIDEIFDSCSKIIWLPAVYLLVSRGGILTPITNKKYIEKDQLSPYTMGMSSLRDTPCNDDLPEVFVKEDELQKYIDIFSPPLLHHLSGELLPSTSTVSS